MSEQLPDQHAAVSDVVAEPDEAPDETPDIDEAAR
jgi:hypothetical protein